MVYVAYTSFVYAINADGTTAWKYPEEADGNKIFYAAPAVSGNQVFVGDYKNILFSLDQQTGRENWSFTEAKDRYIGKPLAVESADLVLLPNADHNLYALNGAGKLQWKFTTGDPIWAQPLTDGTTVYAASMDGYLYALNLTNGQKIWSTNLGAAVVYSLAISDDGSQLYAGTIGSEMVAIDAATGSITWRKPTAGGVWGRAILSDDTLYVGDQSGKIYAMATADGATRWEYAAGAPVIASGALLEEGIAFPVENGNVVALSMNGAALWTQPVNGKLYSNPVITGDRLVVPVTQGEENLLLVSFNANGTQGWTFSQPK